MSTDDENGNELPKRKLPPAAIEMFRHYGSIGGKRGSLASKRRAGKIGGRTRSKAKKLAAQRNIAKASLYRWKKPAA